MRMGTTAREASRLDAGMDPESFCFELPDRPGPNTFILVSVHGVHRRAQEHFDAFAPAIRAMGGCLCTPLFSRDAFPDYQRLGRPGRGLRADLALLDALRQRLRPYGLEDAKIHLFGHSGGGQFVHRFVMVHPESVASYALSAPGWYTFPDELTNYPKGLAAPPGGMAALQLDRFLRVPGCVFVGANDTRRGTTLRRHEDIDRQQGQTRLERARRWVAAMNRSAGERGLGKAIQLHELADAGHSFQGLVRRAHLHDKVLQFLTQHNEATTCCSA